MKKEMYCKQKFSLTKVGQKEPCDITSDHNGRDYQLYALSIRFVFSGHLFMQICLKINGLIFFIKQCVFLFLVL